MLEKGHYGVQLDAEAWDRLITWIDMNTTYHGTWMELAGADRTVGQAERRAEMRKKYTGMDYSLEEILNPYQRGSNQAADFAGRSRTPDRDMSTAIRFE